MKKAEIQEYERKQEQQKELVRALESRLNRPLTDDEKIKLFKGEILLPITSIANRNK